MNFLLKYPTRERPELFKKRVMEWTGMASGLHKLHWLVSIDEDDRSMDVAPYPLFSDLSFVRGSSKGKIHAINRDMDKAPSNWDILVLISDDMACQLKDWDQQIAVDMKKCFPDLNGGIWYPDGRQDRICTFSVFGRPVYDELGYIYHPAYKSVYCDNWYTIFLQDTGRLVKSNTNLVKHEWRKENNDALMKRNEERTNYEEDRKTFLAMVNSYAQSQH